MMCGLTCRSVFVEMAMSSPYRLRIWLLATCSSLNPATFFRQTAYYKMDSIFV